MLLDSAMPQPGSVPDRYSLFSSDTIDDLRTATGEAAHGASGGDAKAAAALRICEQVASAVAASDAGNNDEARRQLGDALAQTTDVRLLFLGFQFHFRLGGYDEAERLVRRRIELAAAESADAGRAWTNLGLIYHFRGDFDNAEAAMRRALEIDTRIGNEFGVARDLGNLALVPEARGDLDTAERMYRESLAIAERIGAGPIIATKLSNLGEIARARGKRDEARTLWVRAERLFREQGAEKYRAQTARWIEELDGPAGVEMPPSS